MTENTARLTTALADRYRIERHLGEGGMATVYLAEDLKHERKVAVKVLRPELAAVLGAERFVQEIKTTAALQHPHILPLHDSGDADGFLYYVMPFIDGETLRDKLNHETQLGIEEAVSITTAIADALDYAHRHNVIHRDIKPENILLHDGRPMVADFGIALAVSAAAGGRMTETGLSLGTPHYMSPEQATAEKDITHRSDIYSLGSVLYEMLTGEPPHIGGSAQAIILKIVTDDARPITELRKSVPPNVAAATAKALERLAADRFSSAAHFAEALTDPAFARPVAQPSPGVATAGHPSTWDRLTIGFASAALVMTIAAGWGWFRQALDPEVNRYSIALPATERLNAARLRRIAISPDGRRFVYVGPADDGAEVLWVRELNSLNARRLEGTELARDPFFSPDGSRIGFWRLRGGTLESISVSGGSPSVVNASARTSAFNTGGTWGSENVFYWTDAATRGLLRASATADSAEVIASPASGSGIAYEWPDALPNGRGLLFVVANSQYARDRQIALLDLSSGSHTILWPGVAARYASSGHILYVTADGILMAVPFDQDAMAVTGESVLLAEGLRVGFEGSVDLSISDTGTLLYATGTADGGNAQPVWVDREGAAVPVDSSWWGGFLHFALSPDGGRLALVENVRRATYIAVMDLANGSRFRLNREPGVLHPTWSVDGQSLTFFSNRDPRGLYTRRADASAPATLFLEASGGCPLQQCALGFSPDGALLVFDFRRRLQTIRPHVDTTGTPIRGGFSGTAAALSPNGRWLAYVSNVSGQQEVYVRPFPDTDRRRIIVSSGGGVGPRWAHSGRELFYMSNTHLVSVDVETDGEFTIGSRRDLFSVLGYVTGVVGTYDVTTDDQRFIMSRNFDEFATGELIIVENFFEELKARVGRTGRGQ